MNIGCIAGVLVLLAGPALADTTAVYAAPGSAFKMTLEIAANGDARADGSAKPSSYSLTRNGEDFTVLSTPQGIVVDRTTDLFEVTAKVASEEMPHLAKIGGTESHDSSAAHFFVAGPVVSINGRPGTQYFLKMGYGRVNLPAVAVISDDPALAPIGRVMARSFEMSAEMSSGMFGAMPPLLTELKELFKSGAPLEFAGTQLVSVSYAPIATSRFVLPGPPESRAAIEKRIRASSTDRSAVVGSTR